MVVVSFCLDHGEQVGWNSSRYDENTKSKGKNFYLLCFTLFFHCEYFYFLHELLICNSILTQVGKGRKKITKPISVIFWAMIFCSELRANEDELINSGTWVFSWRSPFTRIVRDLLKNWTVWEIFGVLWTRFSEVRPATKFSRAFVGDFGLFKQQISLPDRGFFLAEERIFYDLQFCFLL